MLRVNERNTKTWISLAENPNILRFSSQFPAFSIIKSLKIAFYWDFCSFVCFYFLSLPQNRNILGL